MDILFFIIIALMIAITLWWVLKPIFSPPNETDNIARADEEALQELTVKRDAIYSAVKDLELDFESGKISEQDYQQARLKFLQQVANILKKIDAVSGSHSARLDKQVDALLAKASEEAVSADMKAAVRTEIALAARDIPATAASEYQCPGCGHSYTPEDAFCTHCGMALNATCSACGSPIVPGDKFCPQCGEKISAAEEVVSS